MQHRYSVYGVSLSSDIPFDFPGGAAAADAPHVRFVRAEDQGAEPSDADDRWFLCTDLGDGSVRLRWTGLYEFLVHPSGTCVEYRPLADGTPSILQNFLFGQTLSFALIRQNVEPVHAAVVDVGGRAVALLGDCTYGKSTLAAAMLRAGCRLVSDDLLVVRGSHGQLVARPGTGRIKLHPDSAHAVLGESGEGVRLMPGAEKRVFRLAPALVQAADVPLHAFLVLPSPDERAACDRIGIRRIGGPDLFRELVRNTFVRYVDDGTRLRQNFSWNAQLAAAIPGYRLGYPPGLDRLPGVARTVMHQFMRHQQEDTQ